MSVSRLLARQIARATDADGVLQVALLLPMIETAYADCERDARRTDRSIELTVEDNDRLQARLEQAMTELAVQNERFAAAINNMSHGLTMFDAAQALVVANERFRSMYDLPAPLVAPGTTRDQLVVAIAGREVRNERREDDSGTTSATRPRHREWLLADGRTIETTEMRLPTGASVELHEDATERRAATRRIAHMARHDALTALPNRVMFREHIEAALLSTQQEQPTAVLCIDLDQFKQVNDTLGHPVGDELLRLVAERLKHSIRTGDIVSRLGGDEFAIVQGSEEQPHGATQLARRIIDILSKPFDIEGHRVIIGASIGIAITPFDGETSDVLLMNADMALYRAKAEGRNTFRFFEPEMNATSQKRRQIESDMRIAIDERQFELYYQPQISMQTNAITGFEALIRWNHPAQGRISPADFIPIAEDTGVIIQIGEWVLETACATAVTWPEEIRVAVNVSPLQVRKKGLTTTVAQVLEKTGLAPDRLELEITETVMLNDTEHTMSVLHALRAMGVRISMDDFGTGYSSLSYLRRFPFHKIKIDQSFVADIGNDENATLIVHAVTQLVRSLGMSTTIEGVETADQLSVVSRDGFGDVQGYLLSRPLPASTVLSFIEDARRTASLPAAGTSYPPVLPPALAPALAHHFECT